MDESKLRYFVSAATHKSFTAAAQEHHLVTSTISRQIAALEEELGTPLFYREAHSIELTPAGKRLYDAAPGYLRQFRLMNNNVQNLLTEKESRLAIGSGQLDFPLVTRLAELYRTLDPELEVQHIYNKHFFVSRNMLSTDARLYVTTRAVADTLPQCEAVSLGTHTWFLTARRDSPFWALSPEKKALLWDQKVVLPGDSMSPSRLWMEQRVLRHRGFSQGGFFATYCSQIMQGRVALMPEYLEPWLPRELQMSQVFPAPLQVESMLIFNRERATPLEIDFFQYIRDHFKP